MVLVGLSIIRSRLYHLHIALKAKIGSLAFVISIPLIQAISSFASTLILLILPLLVTCACSFGLRIVLFLPERTSTDPSNKVVFTIFSSEYALTSKCVPITLMVIFQSFTSTKNG